MQKTSNEFNEYQTVPCVEQHLYILSALWVEKLLRSSLSLSSTILTSRRVNLVGSFWVPSTIFLISNDHCYLSLQGNFLVMFPKGSIGQLFQPPKNKNTSPLRSFLFSLDHFPFTSWAWKGSLNSSQMLKNDPPHFFFFSFFFPKKKLLPLVIKFYI